MSENEDYYEKLGVDKEASQEEIKKAYREKAKKHHPDKGGKDSDKFWEITRAYEVLGDSEKRSKYDRGESTETEDPMAAVRQKIASLFTFIVDKMGDKIKTTDILKIIRTQIESDRESFHKKREEFEILIDHYKEAKSRLDGEEATFLHETARQKIEEYGTGIESCDDALDKVAKSMDILDKMEYRVDEQEELRQSGLMGTSFYSDMGFEIETGDAE